MTKSKLEEKKEPKLCYIKGNHAYFTTQSLKKQWGDDWDDAPYEYNAGTPYQPYKSTENWKIHEIVFDGEFIQPCDNQVNSHYSVEDINNKQVPWLKTESWIRPEIRIWAGTPMNKFCKFIIKSGGKIYIELQKGGNKYGKI